MKLYYARQTCSMGIHLLLEEIGEPFARQAISFADNEQRSDAFLAVNPKGKVPTLDAGPDGTITEFPAVAFYLGSKFPKAHLLPREPMQQVRALELMDYAIATLHMRGFSRMFKPEGFSEGANLEEVRQRGRRTVEEGFAHFDKVLQDRDYVMGDYSIADASLFILEWWGDQLQRVTLPKRVAAHFERMLARPAVQRMLAAEGLKQEKH